MAILLVSLPECWDPNQAPPHPVPPGLVEELSMVLPALWEPRSSESWLLVLKGSCGVLTQKVAGVWDSVSGLLTQAAVGAASSHATKVLCSPC